MRTDLDPALSAFFAGATRAYSCDLYTITLLSGAVLRWTNSDRDVPYGGNTFVAGPGLDRTKVRMELGLQADDMRVTVWPRATDTAGGVSLRKALARGDFDSASIRLDRGFAALPSDPLIGVVPRHFVGRISVVQSISGGAHQRTGKRPMELLDAPFPRNVYQPQCLNTLYDSVCQLNRATFRVTGTVSGMPLPNMSAFQSDRVEVFGWFSGGSLRFLTGANAGLSMPVKKYEQGAGTFYFPCGWPNTIVAGDTFEAWAGCDKTLSTCGSKFANTAHFRGQPFVPAPETTI